jgi:hypothetical protein
MIAAVDVQDADIGSMAMFLAETCQQNENRTVMHQLSA